MARYLIVALALIGCVIADDSGYAAPQSSGYSAPAGYAAPSAPADAYGVPTYDNTPTYQTESKDLFDLSKLTELLPFFLAVFVAIIFAQLMFPLLGAIFAAKQSLLEPLGGTGITLLNSLLQPFDLAICTTNPLAIAGTTTTGREANGFNLNPEMVSMVSNLLYKAVESYSEQ